MIKETVIQFVSGKITYTGLASGTGMITNWMIANSHILSYSFAMGVRPHAQLDTTSFGFTRGLRENGKCDEKAGLYGSKGGYVVCTDGHVPWFDGDKSARFLKWNKSGYISNIRHIVPNCTWIACGNYGIKTDDTSDGKLVGLY
jgi:hypothetical protein